MGRASTASPSHQSIAGVVGAKDVQVQWLLGLISNCDCPQDTNWASKKEIAISVVSTIIYGSPLPLLVAIPTWL
jgi:hypothetical protein